MAMGKGGGAVLIGAHVSTAGGLVKAVGRGADIGCDAIQVFHQSPRAWRPTPYTAGDYSEFRDAFSASRLEAVVIHAIYLINCASGEREVRRKSLASLRHALEVGRGIGATGVVLHAGARKGEPYEDCVKRAGEGIAQALAETEDCPVLLENTAGTNGPLGRDFDELAELMDAAGGGDRLGTCLDCCHLLAAGFDIRTPGGLSEIIDQFDRRVGLERLRCVHVNDSKVPLGRNLDRHAPLGQGELGSRGLAAFLSEPRFEGLPALLEGPGVGGEAVESADIKLARDLRKRGHAARRRRGH